MQVRSRELQVLDVGAGREHVPLQVVGLRLYEAQRHRLRPSLLSQRGVRGVLPWCPASQLKGPCMKNIKKPIHSTNLAKNCILNTLAGMIFFWPSWSHVVARGEQQQQTTRSEMIKIVSFVFVGCRSIATNNLSREPTSCW